ncbi:uncharacterized protein SPPG_06549 [Spizellomyces punctatus DAOM BR117]|uniref:Zn(2)-C6 fungal-type domain-containing protein n=1 Tax=Spizellomyces punctatus (strain DAOM BR117) TaxID=645134 RepID=A0A0L0H9D6_SPIPD|nr:uncharacterized protein SPPG_06549 [Spizellomyces punctatus DAOM BR117]KNC98145.1 hypothetical protein SPPG_06549 [Spizellomyces punctatus DAOM BR117]|eukprot:XP_016606185.1 hypothetical protein SPPG_06549 [Spizellomyces punctatus DAOM BR117]
MLVGTQSTSEINMAGMCDMDLIMRLHQYAYNPSVYKPNPYVDVSKLNLGAYMQDMFGQDVLSAAEQEVVAPLATTDISTLEQSPERLGQAPLAAVTPIPLGDMPFIFDLGYSQGHLQDHAKQTVTALQACGIPTSPSRPAPASFLPEMESRLLHSTSLDFLDSLGPDVGVGADEEFGSQDSILQDEFDDEPRYTDLSCPSSDFTQADISSPIDFQPPFHGLATPEDDNEFEIYAFGADYTPAPVRTSRRLSHSSLLSEPIAEAPKPKARKRKAAVSDVENEENVDPDMPAQKKIRQKAETRREQCKIACIHCKKACKKCDNLRPCTRCCRMGYADSCLDAPRKERPKSVRRGHYGKKNNNDFRLETASDSGNEWSPSSSEYSRSSSFNEYSCSSPMSFEHLSSPAPSSLYDSDCEFTPNASNRTAAYLATPLTSKASKNGTSPDRHYVSPLNIFAPPVQSRRRLHGRRDD